MFGNMGQKPKQPPPTVKSKFERQLEANPYDIAAWDGRLGEAVRQGNAAPVFEKAVAQFPTAARIWAAYAEYQEPLNARLARSVYERSAQTCCSVDLWNSYLNFSKRCQSLEDTLNLYSKCLDLLGTDWRSGPIWGEYIALLKRAYNAGLKFGSLASSGSNLIDTGATPMKPLQEDANPIEAVRRQMKPPNRRAEIEKDERLRCDDAAFSAVAGALSIEVNTVRNAYQRALISAHSLLDKLWGGYELFEKTLGNSILATKFIAEYQPRMMKGKQVFKELQTMYAGADPYAITLPPAKQNKAMVAKQTEVWRKILKYEKGNPLKLESNLLQPRVTLVFQQASVTCAYQPEFWFDFAAWLDVNKMQEKATQCLSMAVERFLPDHLTLCLLVAHRKELAEVASQGATEEGKEAQEPQGGVDDTYRKLLDGFSKAKPPVQCPLALMHHLSYVRRRHGEHEFRDRFLEATASSPHCTWEVFVFAGLTEFYVFGRKEAAARCFRLGIERFGDSVPSLRTAYVNFLMGTGDIENSRTELSSGVEKMLQLAVKEQQEDKKNQGTKAALGFLWQKWVGLEQLFGDEKSLQKAIRCREEEYRSLTDEEKKKAANICRTPTATGLSASFLELEEGFRFQHLVVSNYKLGRAAEVMRAARELERQEKEKEEKATLPENAPNDHENPEATETAESAEELGNKHAPAENVDPPNIILRPNVTKMLAFRPALDVIGRKKTQANSPIAGNASGSDAAENSSMPATIPKCLQDLLAVLPNRQMKGTKPDVDFLLSVLQTVNIPHVQLQDRNLNGLPSTPAAVKNEADAGRPGSLYRERLLTKRQRLMFA